MILVKLMKAKRGKHVYFAARWRASDGKIRQKHLGKVGKVKDGGMTTQQAKDAAAKLQADINDGTVLRDRPDRVMLSELVDTVRTSEPNVSLQTVAKWRNGATHAIACYGDVPLESIRDPKGARLYGYLNESTKLRPASVRGIVAVTRSLLNKAVGLELIATNPLAGVELGKKPVKDSRVFTPAEAEAMIAAADTVSLPEGAAWWRALIRVGFCTGLRRGELLALRWTDIDFDRAEVHVRERQRCEVVEVGDTVVPVPAFKPKSEESVRTVPLGPDAVLELRRLQIAAAPSPCPFVSVARLRQVAAKVKAKGLDPDTPVPSVMLCSAIIRHFHTLQKAAARAMGCRSVVTPKGKVTTVKADGKGLWKLGAVHDLRDSFATHAASVGVNMVELQAWMGHHSIDVTARFYTSVTPDAADRLRQAFAASA